MHRHRAGGRSRLRPVLASLAPLCVAVACFNNDQGTNLKNPPNLIRVVVSPKTATLAAGSKQQFTVFGRDSAGDNVGPISPLARNSARWRTGTSHAFRAAPITAVSSAQPLWQALYDFHAELILNGHEHNYERFAPQTPTGAADPTNGIREIVAGTGGESHYNDEGRRFRTGRCSTGRRSAC